MSTATNTVIDIHGLGKSFGTVRALDGLDLTVLNGEVHGFLGPNGAGKSTTIRTLLGLLRADTGQVRLFGRDPWKEAPKLHRRLAYVPGDVTLWPGLSGGETIDLLGRLHGTGGSQDRVDELLERFDLDPTKKARTYSKGNRQKVALVAAFAADAELLVLDEPTSGLDPLMEQVFRDCVRQESRRGRTVLLSSHLLSEVEALCDRVSIVREGRTVESGTLNELRHLSRTTVDAEFAPNADTIDGSDVAGWGGVSDVRADNHRIRFDVEPDSLAQVLRRLADSGLVGLTAHPPTLEDLFLRQYQRDGANDDATGDDTTAGGRRDRLVSAAERGRR